MKVRDYKTEDRDELERWWKAHDWTPVPEGILSPLGLMVETDDGVPMAAVWLYQTNSPVMMVEWLVTNPDASPRDSYAAVSMLLKAVKEIASNAESFAMTLIQQPSLVKIFAKHGFLVEEKTYQLAHYGGEG